MWLKLLGSKFFLILENGSALAGTDCLVKDRYWKSGSIQERLITKLAPDNGALLMTQQVGRRTLP